ncbi:hypothetical protein ACJX0J_038124, partial [Zea mays]
FPYLRPSSSIFLIGPYLLLMSGSQEFISKLQLYNLYDLSKPKTDIFVITRIGLFSKRIWS